ncbi:hypothetical protein [Candidatus Chlorohelix sp.]|uniref:hypothetical protein n=1 Tax=Candidatus Chlorohelix sp. TaxID=3139201 RepID=UPI0030664956
MADRIELIFTTLPQGVLHKGLDLPVSALLSPRLVGDSTVLGTYPLMLNWTQLLKDSGMELVFECAGKTLSVPIDTAPLRPDLWHALFKENTPVIPFTFEDLSDSFVPSYPSRLALTAIKGIYQQAGVELALPREGNQERQGRNISRYLEGLQINWDDKKSRELRDKWRRLQRNLFLRLKDGGRLSVGVGLVSQNAKVGADGLPDATQLPQPGTTDSKSLHKYVAEQFAVFHHMPQPDLEKTPDLTKKDAEQVLDFHKVIAALSSYPDLLRLLGLAVDVTLPIDFVAQTGGTQPGKIGVAKVNFNANFPERFTLQLADRPPQYTAYYHFPFVQNQHLFFTAPRGGLNSFEMLGLLNLKPEEYVIGQVEVDSALHKMIILSESADAAQPAQHPEIFDATNTLPSLRSGGMALLADLRAIKLLASFDKTKQTNQKYEANQPQPEPFFVEDLVRGYRLDIFDVTNGKWHSLHRRDETYTVNEIEVNLTDKEGYTRLAVGQPPKDSAGKVATDDLYISEAIARWNGWSLSAPRPEKGLTRNPDPAKAIPPDNINDLPEDDRPNQPVTPFKLVAKFKVVKGSLPSLRFGRCYRLRARVVDLSGRSLELDDPVLPLISPDLGIPRDPEGFAYLRYEPVEPPVVIPRQIEALTLPGSSAERIVIRTFNDNPSKDSASPDLTANDRHIAPPRTSVEIAERHGKFDDATGKLKGDLATYQLIADRDDEQKSQFKREPLPTLINPETNQPETVPVEPDSRLTGVPYLPEPLSRGAAFRDLPGSRSGTLGKATGSAGAVNYTPLSDPNPRPGSATLVSFEGEKDFTEAKPFRLALEEGTEGAHWNPAQRVLTVYLPKAANNIIPLSSYMTAADLKLMGVWQWLREYIEATREAENQFFYTSGLQDKLAHILQRSVEGGHWMLNPPKLLELVNAVQQPIGQPEFTALDVIPPALYKDLIPMSLKFTLDNQADLELYPIQAMRKLGAPEAFLVGALKVHGQSTAKVDLLAEWSEPFDDPTEVPSRKQRSDYVDALPLPNLQEAFIDNSGRFVGYFDPAENLVCFVAGGETLGRVTEGKTLDSTAAPCHHFGDTKHRRVTYKAVATSRYREYFPQNQNLDFTRSSETVTVEIPASARPLSPSVRYAIPTFGWERQTETNLKRSVRYGGGIRVYFERPWYSSGDDELLGAVLYNSSDNNSIDSGDSLKNREQWKRFVTQWGSDPLWDTGSLYDTPYYSSFEGWQFHEEGLTLEENTPLNAAGRHGLVDVVGFPVKFDKPRNLYYCDLTLNADSYNPFVRLALCRYQPYALPDAKLSRVVLADFVQLTPYRAATITADPYHPRKIRLTVTGPAPRGPQPKYINPFILPPDHPTSVTVEVQQKSGSGDLDWVLVNSTTVAVTIEKNGPDSNQPNLSIWSGSFTFTNHPKPGQYRLLITEREFISTDYGTSSGTGGRLNRSFQNAPGRIIYAEIVTLDSALIGI